MSTDLTQLTSSYPGWHIWRSQAGRWWATRIGRDAWDSHQNPDFAMTIDADTLDELATELARQNHESRTAGGF